MGLLDLAQVSDRGVPDDLNLVAHKGASPLKQRD